jgi:hypothetical protein
MTKIIHFFNLEEIYHEQQGNDGRLCENVPFLS